MSQRRNPRGSVEDRWTTRAGTPSANNGKGSRWRARYVDSTGRENVKAFARKSDALAWLAERQASVVVGTHVAAGAGKVGLATLAGRYAEGKSHLTPNSRDSLRSIIDSRIVPEWGDVEVGCILPSDVQHWIAGMVDDGLSASRVRQVFHTFQAILADAMRDRRIASNPCNGIDIPRLTTSKPHRYLTMAELLDLSIRCGSDGDIVLALGLLGLRWGELVALRVGSVDFLRRRLRVDASTAEVGGRLIEGLPKRGQRRGVAIPDVLLPVLARRSEGKATEDRLFTSARGRVLRSRNFRRDAFDPAVEAAGLGDLTLHALRHTAASLAIGAGASVLAVARMLGHSDPTVTLRVYAGLFDAELDDIAARLSSAAADGLKITADDLRTVGPA